MKESRCSRYMLKQRKIASWTKFNHMGLIGISNISLHNYNSANTCILKSSIARIIMYQHNTRMLGRKKLYSMLKTKKVLKKISLTTVLHDNCTSKQTAVTMTSFKWLIIFLTQTSLLPISLSSKTFLLAIFLSSKTLFHEVTWDIWIFVFEIYKQQRKKKSSTNKKILKKKWFKKIPP